MGTDIHAYVAIKDFNDRWKAVNLWEKNKYFDKGSDDPFERDEYCLAEAYVSRDYELFSALSSVRGYLYDPLDGDTSHHDLKDMPEDIANELKRWGQGVYGMAWVSLADLNRAVKDKKTYPKGEGSEWGAHEALKRFRGAVRAFAETDYFYSPEDVRVYYWYDS